MREAVAANDDNQIDDDDFNSFATRLTPLHEVGYLTIEKAMGSDDFADEMAETARLGRSVHKQAGLYLFDEVNRGIAKENARRNSPAMKESALLAAGWVEAPGGGYLPFRGAAGDPLPLGQALKAAGVKIKELAQIDKLDEAMTIQILTELETIIKIDHTGQGRADKAALAVYEPETGLYRADEVVIENLIQRVNPSINGRELASAVSRLRASAPLKAKTRVVRYIPVNNGVFDHTEQELLEFSADFVFLNKCPVDFDPHAESPVIIQPDGTRWEFDEWLGELATDIETGEELEGVRELLWEVLSAVVRPGVRFNKAAFLFSRKGNNGKGTFCDVARSLKGERGHTSIPLSEFEKPFSLTPLMEADAVITDENPVGAFARDLSKFKTVVTGDVFTLERKHKDGYEARFDGMMIQCINDLPKTKDKSESLARRQLFIPFKNHFGGDGVERKYIKSDYLQRPEVLRYVLRRCLQMTHTEFSNPPACRELMAEAQEANNHVVAFFNEKHEEFAWERVPVIFAYDVFKKWYRDTNPGGEPMSRATFAQELLACADGHQEWRPLSGKVRVTQDMQRYEPIIHHLGLNRNPDGTASRWAFGASAGGRSVVHPQQYTGAIERVVARYSDDDTKPGAVKPAAAEAPSAKGVWD